jgi:hypothetical protein
MVWKGTRRGSAYDGFGDEVGQQPIAGKRVVTAVVDVHRRALVVEDVQCVQRARFERLLEKGSARRSNSMTPMSELCKCVTSAESILLKERWALWFQATGNRIVSEDERRCRLSQGMSTWRGG